MCQLSRERISISHVRVCTKGLTLAEGEDSERRRAEEAGVNTIELSVVDALELGILRCLLAEGSRGSNTVDVQCVAGMLSIGNRVVDQSLLVRNALGLSKVDHGIGVGLLSARIRVGEESIDTVFTGELDAGLVGGDVSTTHEAKVLPALSNSWEITLCNTLGNRAVSGTLADVRTFRLLCLAGRRSRSLSTITEK